METMQRDLIDQFVENVPERLYPCVTKTLRVDWENFLQEMNIGEAVQVPWQPWGSQAYAAAYRLEHRLRAVGLSIQVRRRRDVGIITKDRM